MKFWNIKCCISDVLLSYISVSYISPVCLPPVFGGVSVNVNLLSTGARSCHPYAHYILNCVLVVVFGTGKQVYLQSTLGDGHPTCQEQIGY